MRRRASLAVLLLAAALAGNGGCSTRPEPPREVAERLVDLLPAARFSGETELIDLGEPQARRHLGDGWYDDDVDTSGGRTWLWSRGPASSLQIWLAEPRPLRAELRCRPHDRYAEGLPIEVMVNGRPVGSLTLAPGARVYGMELPREALSAGDNWLTFEYRPAGGPGLNRRRAVAWDSIRLRGAGAPAERAAGEPAEEIRVPFHSTIAFALEVPAGARLETELAAEGGSGSLRVTVEGEDGVAADQRLQPGKGCCNPVSLAGDEDRLVRLTLRAEPQDAVGASGVLRVLAPRVTVPQNTAARTATAEPATVEPDTDEPDTGAAPTAVAPAAAAATAAIGARPNVIVYLIDTLRADRLGVYGHPGGLTPNLDAFAREATLFENAVAQAPWTRPSVASIFTGLEPLDHGVWNLKTKLTEGAVTLAERLRDAGYHTAGFSTNHHVTGVFGLDQGFEDFVFFPQDPDSREVNRRVFQWLDTADGSRPFFLYVHTIDPHEPYAPPAELREKFAPGLPPGFGRKPSLERAAAATGEERRELMGHLAALYDAEVVHNDRSFGEFVAELRRRGVYDDAWVVMLADHGEEFDDNGELGHSNNLHAATVDVPLLVKPPRQRTGARVSRVVQQIDLTVTLLRAAGVPVPGELRGRDLLAPAAAAPRDVYSHLANRRFAMSVRRDGWKLIQSLEHPDEVPRLYRRQGAADRSEKEDLAARLSLRAEYLRSLLVLEIARPRGHLHSGEADIDPQTRDGLRALGYL